MKTIAQQVSLQGQRETISVTQLRTCPGEVLAQVALGKVYVIKRNGKQVAVLSRVPGEQLSMVVTPVGEIVYIDENQKNKQEHPPGPVQPPGR